MKHHTLIVSGDRYSLSNDTDSDPMSDYSPGIWAVKSQKSIIEFAKRYLERGDEIKVTCYDNPNHMGIANKMIKELGLKQELFPEQKAEPVVNCGSSPSNLNQLKKLLVIGKKIRIVRFRDDGEESRETFIKKVQSNNVVVDKSGSNSWIEFDKSINWSFNKDGATYYWLNKDGKRPVFRIEYINQ